MQLKLRRSQRDSGVVSRSVVFCLDARAEYTRDELDSIQRYKLSGQVIYNSEASRQYLERASVHQDGSVGGSLRALGQIGLAAMRLNITVGSLSKGQHIECKSMDELLAAEEALVDACKNLKNFLDAAATFDGREVLIDFSTETPAVVAQSGPELVARPSPEPDYPRGPAGGPSEPAFAAEANPWSQGTPDPMHNIVEWWNGLPRNAKLILGFGAVFILYLFLRSCG